MISEITTNLYIGTIHDAIHDPMKWGLRICVAEWAELSDEERSDLMVVSRALLYLPFMEYSRTYPDDPYARQNSWANTNKLGVIANVIELALMAGPVPVLIHCAAGVERSPLAVVYYLVAKHRHSFQSAYDYVKLRRPVIEDRLSWILDGQAEK